MAQNDVFRRFLDAALSFTEMTQAKAESVVADLVKAGAVQADQAREVVSELVERSRRSSERIIETVRAEVRQQVTDRGLATQEDLDRLEARISEAVASAVKAATAAAERATATAKKAATKKAPAKKAPAKAAAKKAPAKKAPAKKKAAAKKAATKNKTAATKAAKKRA